MPLIVHGDMHHFGLVGGECAERAHVRGALGQHHVAGVDEDPGDQVERLLGADGDDHVVGPGLDALQAHDVADLLAQVRVALAGAVLQRDRAAPGDQVGDQLADHVEGKSGDVRHAAGERDHLRPRRDGEKSSNLGGDHPGSSCGVPIDVGVDARPLGRGASDRDPALAVTAHLLAVEHTCSCRDTRLRQSDMSPRDGPRTVVESAGGAVTGLRCQLETRFSRVFRHGLHSLARIGASSCRVGWSTSPWTTSETCRAAAGGASSGSWTLSAAERAVEAGDPGLEKEAWISATLLEWGSCGKIVYVDGVPAGFVLYAPPLYVPRSVAFPTSPVSADAVLLMTAHIIPEFAGGGLGRMLVQGVAKDLTRRGVKAIEAFGDLKWEAARAAWCPPITCSRWGSRLSGRICAFRGSGWSSRPPSPGVRTSRWPWSGSWGR